MVGLTNEPGSQAVRSPPQAKPVNILYNEWPLAFLTHPQKHQHIWEICSPKGIPAEHPNRIETTHNNRANAVQPELQPALRLEGGGEGRHARRWYRTMKYWVGASRNRTHNLTMTKRSRRRKDHVLQHKGATNTIPKACMDVCACGCVVEERHAQHWLSTKRTLMLFRPHPYVTNACQHWPRSGMLFRCHPYVTTGALVRSCENRPGRAMPQRTTDLVRASSA